MKSEYTSHRSLIIPTLMVRSARMKRAAGHQGRPSKAAPAHSVAITTPDGQIEVRQKGNLIECKHSTARPTQLYRCRRQPVCALCTAGPLMSAHAPSHPFSGLRADSERSEWPQSSAEWLQVMHELQSTAANTPWAVLRSQSASSISSQGSAVAVLPGVALHKGPGTEATGRVYGLPSFRFLR